MQWTEQHHGNHAWPWQPDPPQIASCQTSWCFCEAVPLLWSCYMHSVYLCVLCTCSRIHTSASAYIHVRMCTLHQRSIKWVNFIFCEPEWLLLTMCDQFLLCISIMCPDITTLYMSKAKISIQHNNSMPKYKSKWPVLVRRKGSNPKSLTCSISIIRDIVLYWFSLRCPACTTIIYYNETKSMISIYLVWYDSVTTWQCFTILT